MNGPRISVVIPVYNVENYLSRCLDSCLMQTLYDIEIICVDDGSTDGSADIAAAYARMDPRVQVIRQANGGLSSARNTGISAAAGHWIMFLDSDDCLAENACERIWIESIEAPADVIIFGADTFPAYPKARGWYDQVLGVQDHRENRFLPRVLFDTPGSKPFVWRHAYDAAHLLKTGVRFDETVRYGEDMVFIMEIFPQTSRFSFISDTLYHYRWYRPSSMMETANQDMLHLISQHAALTDRICAYWQDRGWIDRYDRDFIRWFVDFLMIDWVRNKQPDDQKRQAAEEIRALVQKYHLDAHRGLLNFHQKRLWNQVLSA